MPVGTLGSSLTPERAIHLSVFSLFPCDVGSRQGFLECSSPMSSLNVLFFACHHLESTTLQSSRVDGLVDAMCGLPCGISTLLEYMPIFLSQFSIGLLRLLGSPNMWHVKCYAGIADGKRSTSVQSFLSFSTLHWHYSNRHHNNVLNYSMSLWRRYSLMKSLWTACVGLPKPTCWFYIWHLLHLQSEGQQYTR